MLKAIRNEHGCQYVSANCPDNVPVSYGFAGKKSFSEHYDRRGYSDKYCAVCPETGHRKV